MQQCHSSLEPHVGSDMKHLVMLCGVYYPNPSATGKCADRYVDLLNGEYDIDVIYISSTSEDNAVHHHDGKRLYPQTGWRMRMEQVALRNCQAFGHGFKYHMWKSWVCILKIIGRIQSYCLFPNNLHWYYRAAIEELSSIHKDKPIDVLFSVSSPFAAHLAAKHFKECHPSVRWTGYTADPYSDASAIIPLYLDHTKATKKEAECLSLMDHCFLSEEIVAYRKDLCDLITTDVTPLPYLLPEPSTIHYTKKDHIFEKGKTHLVYAGRFYNKIRNPEYLLRLILEMQGDIVLHLYCESDCDELIDAYVKKSHGKIIRHAMVPYEEIKRIYEAADILVNVENLTPVFQPSKVFEYIVTGKPILNIARSGFSEPVLNKYPIICSIEHGSEYQEAVGTFQDFIQNNNKKYVPKELISYVYAKHGAAEILTQIRDHFSPTDNAG